MPTGFQVNFPGRSDHSEGDGRLRFWPGRVQRTAVYRVRRGALGFFVNAQIRELHSRLRERFGYSTHDDIGLSRKQTGNVFYGVLVSPIVHSQWLHRFSRGMAASVLALGASLRVACVPIRTLLGRLIALVSQCERCVLPYALWPRGYNY